MSDQQKIIDILKNPNPNKDYVIVTDNIKTVGNLGFNINVNHLCTDIKKMNIIVAYIGETIDIGKNLNYLFNIDSSNISNTDCASSNSINGTSTGDIILQVHKTNKKQVVSESGVKAVQKMFENEDDPINNIMILSDITVGGDINVPINFKKSAESIPISNNKNSQTSGDFILSIQNDVPFSKRNFLFAYLGDSITVGGDLKIKIESGNEVSHDIKYTTQTTSSHPDYPSNVSDEPLPEKQCPPMNICPPEKQCPPMNVCPPNECPPNECPPNECPPNEACSECNKKPMYIIIIVLLILFILSAVGCVMLANKNKK